MKRQLTKEESKELDIKLNNPSISKGYFQTPPVCTKVASQQEVQTIVRLLIELLAKPFSNTYVKIDDKIYLDAGKEISVVVNTDEKIFKYFNNIYEVDAIPEDAKEITNNNTKEQPTETTDNARPVHPSRKETSSRAASASTTAQQYKATGALSKE